MSTTKPILFTGEMVRAILDGRKTVTRRVVKFSDGFCRAEHISGPEDAYGVEFTDDHASAMFLVAGDMGYTAPVKCPYGQPGGLIWVRETHRRWCPEEEPRGYNWRVRYAADGALSVTGTIWDEGPQYMNPSDTGLDVEPSKWRPSIHMPRWASRLNLRLTDVRVERVQDITQDDVFAEGVQLPVHPESGRLLLDISSRYAPVNYLPLRFGGRYEWSASDVAVAHFASIWDRINSARGYPWANNPWVWVLGFEVIG